MTQTQRPRLVLAVKRLPFAGEQDRLVLIHQEAQRGWTYKGIGKLDGLAYFYLIKA